MMLDTRAERVSLVLHEAGAPSWYAATHHPMVLEIGSGSLPHEKFRRYFEQNVLYLQDYARALGLIAGKAPDLAAIQTLARFLARIVETEIPANLRFLERLGGDAPDAIEAMEPTTYAYSRHLLHVSAQGDVAEGLTAVLPCQWSYGELAAPLVERPPADPIYASWIDMFGNDDYDDLVGQTTSLLDRLADPADEERMRRLLAIFERSTRYEVQFWDMAYGDPHQG